MAAFLRGNRQVGEDVDHVGAGQHENDDRGDHLHEPQPRVEVVHHAGLTPEFAQFNRAERHFAGGEDKVQHDDEQKDGAAYLGKIGGFKESGDAVHQIRAENDARNEQHVHEHEEAQQDTGEHLHNIGISRNIAAQFDMRRNVRLIHFLISSSMIKKRTCPLCF